MENGAIKLASKNKLLYGSDDYITGNQWIALKEKATLEERCRVSGMLDTKCGGGAITHIQINAPFTDEEQAYKVLKFAAEKGVIYFAFNLSINIDKENHSFTSKLCPLCGATPIDSYHRIVGYLVPTSSWSDGRKRELDERKWLSLNDGVLE